MKPLTIVRLGAENIKRLKAVQIVPQSGTVVISGKNDQGKTSVLDAIEYALGGKGTICEEPVRKGQQRARIICDLGEFVVERTFSSVSGDSEIRVRGKDGQPVKSPQTLLDSLCSRIAFEPLSFVRMKADEQVEHLRKLVGLDFVDLETKKAKAYQDRTLAGRELDRAKAKLTDAPFDETAPAVEVSVVELTNRLNMARSKNAERTAALGQVQVLANARAQQMTQRDSLLVQIEDLQKQITEKERQVMALNASVASCDAQIVIAEKAAAQFPAVDESAIASEIAASESINARVRANVRHASIQAEITANQATVDRLTFEIESVDQEKHDRLEWTKFPLEGLSFDDSRVLLNGVPFSQASQARQLQAAVAIGLALNPTVRVILVRDASLLDDESMRLMADMAQKHEAQIWLEVVNSKDPAAVVIEDGEVKAVAT